MKASGVALGMILWLLGCSAAWSDSRISKPWALAGKHARDIGLGLHVYALEHEGKLPEEVGALVEEGILTNELIDVLVLTAPGVELDKLPPHSVIAFLIMEGEQRGVILVEASGATRSVRMASSRPEKAPLWSPVSITVCVIGWLTAAMLCRRRYRGDWKEVTVFDDA